MYVQLIRGFVEDRDRFSRDMEAGWTALAPGAAGFLDGTCGVSADGFAVIIGRFESAEAAWENASRPEQQSWWANMETQFEDGTTYTETTDVDVILDGGTDAAGFVQIIDMRVSDRSRWSALEAELTEHLHALRPDVIGGLHLWFPAGKLVQVVYFTSEDAARQGEKAEPPPEVQSLMDEWSAYVSDLHFVDLPAPLLVGP